MSPSQNYPILKAYKSRANMNRDFPKINIFEISKSIFSHIYFPIILKMNLIVLRVNKELSQFWNEQNFLIKPKNIRTTKLSFRIIGKEI